LSALSVLDPRLKTLASDTTVVCRCEDVSFGALRKHHCWRDAKLQTRCGMGPCQGRICGAATEFLFGWDTASIIANSRPPVFPARVASLGFSGELERPGQNPAPAETLIEIQKETS
jgi:hypothetical protein